jgi:hypothetical protein
MTKLREHQTEIPLSRKKLGFSFAGTFAFLYLRTFLLPNTPFAALDDQSLFFARAEHMVQGQIPYRDFFEIVTPGTELLYSAAFRLFGIHAWIMPAWAIAVGLAFFGLITFISNKVLRGTSVWLPAWLFLIFDFNSGLDMTHHWFSTLAALAAAAVLMDGLTPRRILASSFLCATAVLFTQTKGALVFFAIALYLVIVHWSKTRGRGVWLHLTIFIVPFLLITTSVLGYYIYLSGLHAVFFDIIEFPVKFMTSSEVNRPETYFQEMGQSFHVRSVQQTISLISTLFVYVLVPYVYIAGLYELWRGRGRFSIQLRQNLVLLHLVGIALFLAIASAPRHFRRCTVAPPAILIFVWLLSRGGRARSYVRNLSWALTVFYAILLPVHRQTQWHGTLNLPIGRTAFSDEEHFREFQWVAQRTHPSEALFNQSALDLYLSLKNPAGTESVSYDETTRPEQITALLYALQRKPPAYIVAAPVNLTSDRNEGHAGPFSRYLYDNYKLVAMFPLDHSRYQQELWEHKPSSQSEPQ